MKKILNFFEFTLVICCLIMAAGCAKSSIPNDYNSLGDTAAEHVGSTAQDIQQVSLNTESNQRDTTPGTRNNGQTYINPDDIEWVTMQGGLHITTKVLFPGHDDEKINRIVSKINAGTGKTESTETEINVIHSRARPIGISFMLKDGSRAFIWPDYTVKTFKDGWSASPLSDRFVLNIENGSKDEYYTVFSKDVAEYLRTGYKSDMPAVKEVEVMSGSNTSGDKIVIRDGDQAIVKGDGCTAKEVIIRIMRNGAPKEIYTVGKAVPRYGIWEWRGSVSRQCKTLDGKNITLANDLYDIIADADGNQTGACAVIDFRKVK